MLEIQQVWLVQPFAVSRERVQSGNHHVRACMINKLHWALKLIQVTPWWILTGCALKNQKLLGSENKHFATRPVDRERDMNDVSMLVLLRRLLSELE